MKKYLPSIVFSLVIGFVMAYLLINSYSDSASITVSKNAQTVYYIQSGVYSSKENMEKGMEEFNYYIYNVEDNLYYTYIGITKSKKNSEKLQEFYTKKGFNIYVREKTTDNENLLTVLGQYDEILSQTDDENTIQVICNQVLTKYEEVINGEYQD